MTARRLVTIYALCTLAFVAFGAIEFREYYTPVVELDPRAGIEVIENEVLREWDAVTPHYSRYISPTPSSRFPDRVRARPSASSAAPARSVRTRR
jgi:hypothetical protein